MATRPHFKTQNLTTEVRIVETATTVTLGCAVKDGNADGECQPLAAKADLGIGFVVDLLGNGGVAGSRVLVCMLAGGGVIPVKVGAGGATAGQFAKFISASAVGDAAPTAQATGTAARTLGYFTQTGVSGDIVGLVPMAGWCTEV